MTWAGKQSEQPRSFQSPETYLLLTFSFIELAKLDEAAPCQGHLLAILEKQYGPDNPVIVPTLTSEAQN
jgi:hypothetical protein